MMIAATLRRFGICCVAAVGLSGSGPVGAAESAEPASAPAARLGPIAESAFVPSPGGGTVRTAADRRLREALAKTYDEAWEELPLETLVPRLEKLLGVRVTVDRPALETEGVGLDHALALDLRGQPFEDALSAELEMHHLAAFPQRGMLRLTSKSRAYSEAAGLLTGSYDVRDLVVRTYSDGVESVEPAPLVKLVEDSCGSDSEWVDIGGTSTVRFFTAEGIDSMTVRAPYRTHRAIEELLASLRAQRREGVPPRRRPPPPPANQGVGGNCTPMSPGCCGQGIGCGGGGLGGPGKAIGQGGGGFFAVPPASVVRP